MRPSLPRLLRLLEGTLPWLSAALIMIFTYAKFFHLPYAGFDIVGDTGEIYEVYVAAPPGADLQVGDQLIRVGSISLDRFRDDFWVTLFDDVQPGQVAPLDIVRQGQPASISWVIPGHNAPEAWQRLNSEWLLAWAFWAAGAFTSLHLRPRDERQRLLSAFNFTTAVWLMAGAVSRWHLWGSPLVLRSAVWLSLPLYLHLHWVFPQPLGRLPRAGVWAAYLAALGIAALEWLQIPPRNAYVGGFVATVVGSFALLIVHARRQPRQRRDVRLLWAIAGLALLFPIVVVVIELFGPTVPLAGGVFLVFPALPVAYLYTAYRRQMGANELRANRWLAVYIFSILALLIFILLSTLFNPWPDRAGAAAGVGAALMAVVVTALGFDRFQRWLEGRLLGIPPAVRSLPEAHAAQVATKVSQQALADLLAQEVLPRLLVRQWALVGCEAGRLSLLRAAGVEAAQLPQDGQMAALQALAGRYLPPGEPSPCPWARVILPLNVGDKLIGLWLLGRRDPDDFYAGLEITALQAVAAQTAIALANISQTERLRLLHQINIERQEVERTRLARELHDEVLNQLGILINYEDIQPGLVAGLTALAERLRHTISGLRPKVLDFGLPVALEHLADDLAERARDSLAVTVEVAGDGERYPGHVEEHIYRIVQQAAENALEHAHAARLLITGRLEAGLIDLTVDDDGQGFDASPHADLNTYAARRHYGLTGMFERAALIGAQLKIDSGPGRGTRVRLTLTLDKPPNQPGESPHEG